MYYSDIVGLNDLVVQPFPRHLHLTFANDYMNWAFGLFAVSLEGNLTYALNCAEGNVGVG
jgi:hypothetical protein